MRNQQGMLLAMEYLIMKPTKIKKKIVTFKLKKNKPKHREPC